MEKITQALIETQLSDFCKKLNQQIDGDYTIEDLRPALKIPHPDFYFEMFMQKRGLDELSERTRLLLEILFWHGFNVCVHTIQDCQALDLDQKVKDIILSQLMIIADQIYGELHRKNFEE